MSQHDPHVETLTGSQAQLLADLKEAGWGNLPWSSADANRYTLRIDMDGGYTLVAGAGFGGPSVSLYSTFGGEHDPHVKTPADALLTMERWNSEHAAKAENTSKATRELRAMIGEG
jgi:hypothetical protein